MTAAGSRCDAQRMVETDPDEFADDGPAVTRHRSHRRDQDGVDSLRDTEAEAGDEEEIIDDYDMDDREARELGADLEDREEPEPGFS